MAKVRLTRIELKRQKDALKRFLRYLPTLILKKQQLQLEVRRIDHAIAECARAAEERIGGFRSWIAVLGEEIGVEDLIGEPHLEIGRENIAGVEIPLFRGLSLGRKPYDLFSAPLWVDRALDSIEEILRLEAEIIVLSEQKRRLEHELRITTQRVNLFEKVKIPETRDYIRRIQINLGDQQTAAVVRGKISKGKLVKVSQA